MPRPRYQERDLSAPGVQRAPGLSRRPLRTADPGPPGQAVGTLLGCTRGISRPRPPTVRLSSCPNCGDSDHQRVGPTPVTVRHPEFWIRTAWNSCPPAANLSRTSPPSAAGQCSPGGISGGVQSAAARIRTWCASAIVIPRGRISRNWLDIGLATTRSTVWAVARSGMPSDVLTAAGSCTWPVPAAAGCLAPGTALPHAASPITAPTAIAGGPGHGAAGSPCVLGALSLWTSAAGLLTGW